MKLPPDVKIKMRSLWNDYSKLGMLVLLAILLWYFVSLTAAFFWTVFLAFIIYNIDSTIIAQAALICLVAIPLMLALHRDGPAEQIAVYAYFLLSMTVGLQIIELMRTKNSDDDTGMPPASPQPLVPAAIEGMKKVRKMITDIIPHNHAGSNHYLILKPKEIDRHDDIL